MNVNAQAAISGEPPTITACRRIVANHQHAMIPCPGTRRKQRVDALTANAIVTVYDALNTENRAKFAALSLPRMVAVAFRLVKGSAS